jgi:hypothetical protein
VDASGAAFELRDWFGGLPTRRLSRARWAWPNASLRLQERLRGAEASGASQAELDALTDAVVLGQEVHERLGWSLEQVLRRIGATLLDVYEVR